MKITRFFLLGLLSISMLFILTGCPEFFGGDDGSPVISAGPDQGGVQLGATVTLTGTAVDPDGDLMDYSWTFEAIPTASALTNSSIMDSDALVATFTPDVEGEYEVEFSVFDGANTTVDTVLITVVENPRDLAIAYVGDATECMRNQDYDGAYSYFTLAVTTDDSYGPAIIGYAMMDIAAMTIDEDMITLATDNLGFSDYPDSMNELFTDEWLEELYDDTDTSYYIFPHISGQAEFDLDESGYISMMEKMYAFINYFVGHNDGFNDLVEGVFETVLGTRLDLALATIDTIAEDDQLVLTWDMFFDSEEDALYDWPQDADENLLDIVIGKAEVLTLSMGIQMARYFTYMAQVYNYSLPLDDYWTWFYENEMSGYPEYTPFEWGFLSASAEAADFLVSAKDALQAAIDDVQSAGDMVLAREASEGFSIAEDSDFLTDLNASDDIWGIIEAGIEFEDKYMTEIETSLNDGTMAYFPTCIDATSYYGPEEFFESKVTYWPTEVDNIEYTSYGFNWGAFHADPRFAISAIFELDSEGEPVFYTWNEDTNSFATLAEAPEPEADTVFYIRVQDITFGGSLDTAILPMDDYSTQFILNSMSYDDADENYTWTYTDNETISLYEDGTDVVETITEFYWSWELEGFIDMYNIEAYYGDNPASFYTTFDANGLSTDSLSGWADDPEFLRSYLAFLGSDNETGPIPVLADDNSVYFTVGGMPMAFFVWSSMTNEGDVSTSGDYESSGSFWWSLLSMLPM